MGDTRLSHAAVANKAEELGIVESHKMIGARNGSKYLRIKLKPDTDRDKVHQLFNWVESIVKTSRTFSHNPVRETVNITLYPQQPKRNR